MIATVELNGTAEFLILSVKNCYPKGFFDLNLSYFTDTLLSLFLSPSVDCEIFPFIYGYELIL